MKASIRELRISLKRILGFVQYGEEVTIYSRGHAIAKIIPLSRKQIPQEDYGFGMWKDYAELNEVDHYVRKLRKGRKHAI